MNSHPEFADEFEWETIKNLTTSTIFAALVDSVKYFIVVSRNLSKLCSYICIYR
jgi:hypothetical protein